MKPTVLDLFSGCGGFSYGFQQTGYTVVGFVELWKPAIATYLRNHPHATHLGADITQLCDKDLLAYKDKIDVIIGGPPCQGFSICGRRDKQDTRNQLYKEYLRCVRIINPKMVIIENVKGVLSMHDHDHERLISKMVHELIVLGYAVCYKLLNAADYGVPQRRERLILIGIKHDFFPQPTSSHHNAIQALWDLPDAENGMNAHVQFHPTQRTYKRIQHLQEGQRLCPTFNRSRQRIHAHAPAPTVMTRLSFIHPIYDRFLTPRELARLQSFPDTFLFEGSKTSMVQQIGNAVPPALAKAIATKLKEHLP